MPLATAFRGDKVLLGTPLVLRKNTALNDFGSRGDTLDMIEALEAFYAPP